MKMNKFKYKCICDWSKDDEYGFIPNTECPAHGKQTIEILKSTIPINSQQIKKDKDDGSNVSLSGDTKQRQRKNNKEEQMSVDAKHLLNIVDNQSADNNLK